MLGIVLCLIFVSAIGQRPRNYLSCCCCCYWCCCCWCPCPSPFGSFPLKRNLSEKKSPWLGFKPGPSSSPAKHSINWAIAPLRKFFYLRDAVRSERKLSCQLWSQASQNDPWRRWRSKKLGIIWNGILEANYLNERIKISAESFSKTISTEVFCFRRVDWVLGLFVKQSGDDENLSWLRLNGIIVVSSNLWITFSRKHGIMGHWKNISQKSKKLVRSFGYTPWSTHLRYHVYIPSKT